MSYRSATEPGSTPVRMEWAFRGEVERDGSDLHDVARFALGAWVASLAIFAYKFVCDGATVLVGRWAIVELVFLALWGVIFLRRVPRVP